jgi:DNA-packaging protein gp3
VYNIKQNRRNTVYRPPKYTDPVVIGKKINDYFDECDKLGKPYTIQSLTYFLGFADMDSFQTYLKKPKFNGTMTRAKMKIQSQRVETLCNGETKNVRGLMFDLTNNFGWREKLDIEHSGLPELPQTLQVKIINANCKE